MLVRPIDKHGLGFSTRSIYTIIYFSKNIHTMKILSRQKLIRGARIRKEKRKKEKKEDSQNPQTGE